MLFLKLRPLKSFGQIFTNGLLYDTGACKTDQCARLSNMKIA